MKKTFNAFRSKNLTGPLIALCLLVFSSNLHAQIFVKDKDGKTQTVATQEWVREYFKSLQNPTPKPDPIPDTRPDCKVGLTLTSVVPGQNQLEFNFHSLDVQSIDYKINSGNAVIMSGNTGQLTSSKVFIPHSLQAGNYTLQIRAVNCKSDSVSGIKPFTVAQRSGKYNLTPLKDPLLPEIELTGDYELRYLESREDEHLKLSITQKDGQIYLTDNGKSLQSASYTLNGWTDLDNCGKLENEPIRSHREYHLLKFSIAASNIKDDFWRADPVNTSFPIAFKRSEVFFFVVPKGSTWNPAGESPNPIGRPAAFEKIPAFSLKNRAYGFEYDFNDESDARKAELGIQFNWQKGKRHLKLYASVLTGYLNTLPVRKGFEDLTEKECVAFANTLPIEYILAFDIEPGTGNEWIINFDGPNFVRNMAIVINRLKERGAMAYNWLDSPNKSPNVLTFEGTTFGTGGNYGKDLAKFSKMYAHIGEVKKRSNPYSLISTGYGYAGYDANFSETDGKGQNISPQLTYLRALDVSELWKRVWSEKEQCYFSWPFQEFNVIDFPRNHIVDIPEYDARARRTDNKPLYPPALWQDNLTLGLINAKYLFYWTPGPVGWDPANTSSYNNAYTNGFSTWTYEYGSTPIMPNFYIGKEVNAVNATIKAAYTFSQIQDAMDGSRTGLKFKYRRANKDGSVLAEIQVPEITDGSWYNKSLTQRQPFVIFCKNGNNKALLVQDVWARPGRWTEFEIEIEGKVYTGITEGNRLFVAKL